MYSTSVARDLVYLKEQAYLDEGVFGGAVKRVKGAFKPKPKSIYRPAGTNDPTKSFLGRKILSRKALEKRRKLAKSGKLDLTNEAYIEEGLRDVAKKVKGKIHDWNVERQLKPGEILVGKKGSKKAYAYPPGHKSLEQQNSENTDKLFSRKSPRQYTNPKKY